MNSSSYANDTEFAVEEPMKISTQPEKRDSISVQVLDGI